MHVGKRRAGARPVMGKGEGREGELRKPNQIIISKINKVCIFMLFSSSSFGTISLYNK